jgi:hypothetical protein
MAETDAPAPWRPVRQAASAPRGVLRYLLVVVTVIAGLKSILN